MLTTLLLETAELPLWAGLVHGSSHKLPSLRSFAVRVQRLGERTMHRIGLGLASRLGGVFYQDSADRTVLENVIFPYYQLSGEHQRIVFVGCDWYTAGYPRRFAGKAFSTIDPDPARARYGGKPHHVAPMSALAASVAPQSLDLILCNGIIGFGLDDVREAEASFEAAYQALRPGGHFILGWNDVERHAPFRPADVAALARFERLVFPPLGQMQHRVDHDMRHVFEFYVKP